MPVVSVVIPLFREGEHLARSVASILQVLQSMGETFELVLVDDGSPDNTWEQITRLREAHAEITGIRLSRNFGKEAALAAGLDKARGQAVLVMDGDLQHPPALIPQMLHLWRSGADVVEAVKRSRGRESISSRLRAGLFYRIFTRLTGVDIKGASDFKLMDRRVVDAWQLLRERNLFFRGMNAWLGFNRVQLPFDVAERAEGRSSWSLLQLLKLAFTAVTSFSSAPLYMMIFMGLVFIALALVIGAQTLYMKFSGLAVDGFTTVILLLLLIGGVLSFGLGLVGVYIARIYEEVKGRPRYIIAEQID
ncbi:MAG: glycosyltransferase family 2 protein [Gammaproteobacteria bacterium]|nr:glycosyltransferase family 2 protein [Gammaproteobacteria bacterium]